MDPYNRLDRNRIPSRWYVATQTSGIGFRHRDRDVTVEAVEADGPQREFSGRWQLRCHHRANEAESHRVVGHVTSESEALGALFAWMERINAADRESETALDVATLGRQTAADASPQSSTHWTGDEHRLSDGDPAASHSPDPGPGGRTPQGGNSRGRVQR